MSVKRRDSDKFIKDIAQSVSYEYEGRQYIVTPYFKEKGVETLGSLILKMMKSDIENNRI